MMRTCTMLATAIAIILPIMISAECQCTASGDPHYVMCDKQTRFDFQAEGLFTAFKSDDLEVQVYQAMAKDKPVSYVDYCSIKFVKDDCTFVMKTRSIKEPNNVVMNGEKMVVTNGPAWISKELDKNLGITMDNDHDMVFKTKEGNVHVICKPQAMIIRAPSVTKCDGLCGNCSGKPQTKPDKPIQHASKETQQPSGSCKPKAATPAPTPAPSTPAPTPAPSTPAPTNATSAPTTPPPTTNATKAPTPAPTANATSAPTTAPATSAPTTQPPAANATSTPAPTTAPATSAPTTQPPAANATSTPAPTTTAATPAPDNGTAAPTPAPVTNGTSAPTSAPATPAPSSNATTAPTSAPTLPPVNASIAPPPVKEADKSQIVGHPVFESEEVMKKVINACMCGQPKERMDVDKEFGGFVESCIYDKSLGPNEEDVAASNMEAFLKTVTPIPPVAFNNDSAPVTPAPTTPQVTVIGNVTFSNVNFDTSAIREKHVTKLPLEIHPTAGVSYKLRYSIPDEDVALVPQLMPRPQVFTGAGERTEAIQPTPAQQMAMAQQGMPMPASPMGAATSPISPPGSPSMPTGSASMPTASGSMPAPGASMPAPGASMPALPGSSPQGSSPASYLMRPGMGGRPEADKFPSNSPNDDDKLKVRFELEAPVIVSK